MGILRRIEGTKSKREPHMYETEDKRISVSCRKGRSWSGDRGSYAFQEWTAVLRSKVVVGDDVLYTIARGRTLADCEKRLTRYLTDEKAGNLKARYHYGFSGDQRPVATEGA